MDPYAMRELYTWGSITTALTPIIILFSEKYGIVLLKNRKSKILIILINLIALYLTASRTYYFIFLVFLFIFLYKINKRKLALIGTIMAIVMILTINLNSDSKLATKIISTITETNISDYNSAADINNKYRGYETYMALKTYLNGTPLNLLLGHGFQKEVDLGTYVMLGDTQRRFIPILHNGYAYQLLREGLLGLILVIIFFVKIFRLKPIDDISNFNYQIAIGSILSLLFSNFVISTFFSAEMLQLWLFIGTYLVCIEMKKKSIIPIGVEYVKKEEQV
jgi:O-antigen ligase